MANLTEAGSVEGRSPPQEARHAQTTTTAPATRSRPELGPRHPRLPRMSTSDPGPLHELPHHHHPRWRPPPDPVDPTLSQSRLPPLPPPLPARGRAPLRL